MGAAKRSERRNKGCDSVKSRILVAIVGVPVLVYVVLWAPSVVMMIVLCLLAGIGSWELQHCVNGGERFEWDSVGVLFSMWAIWVFYKRPDEIAVSFLRLEASGIHRGWLLLPFILSFACDTFAYFAGLTLGRHKLAPKVSPKKTVEGSIGGLAGNVVCGLLFAYVMDRWFGASINAVPMALLSLICGVVAQIGDLSFSLIKREFGIKDYGHLFLEHGGVLDRFDSVLFVAPTVEIALTLFSSVSFGLLN